MFSQPGPSYSKTRKKPGGYDQIGRLREYAYGTFYNRLNQYGSRCEWLKDDKFLRDLEGDSVDTEILDEELRSLQEDEPKTCRGKTVKLLASNPFQIVLCVLVLVDAGVVIAEILLDLDAIRGQYHDVEAELNQAAGFLRYSYADDLQGYESANIHELLYILAQKYGDYSQYNMTEDGPSKNRTARHLLELLGNSQFLTVLGAENTPTSAKMHRSQEDALWVTRPPGSPEGAAGGGGGHVTGFFGDYDMQNSMQPEQPSAVRIRHANKRLRSKGGGSPQLADTQRSSPAYANRLKRDTDLDDAGDPMNANSTAEPNDGNSTETRFKYKPYKPKMSKSDKLLKIAHILHYCSIAILGVFVVQLFLRMYGMGKEFFRRKMELFDGAIIISSFALDLVFFNGVGGAQGEEAAALLIVFLLWRILRVINGIMVTAKKRQEFRIKLQKRARRRAEKKIEALEDDKLFKDKEINALRELCSVKGAEEEELKSCKPRRRSVFQKLDTSAGLSSIASLSLGLSMSMSGAMQNNQRSINHTQGGAAPPGNRRDSLQDFMFMGGMGKNRRVSTGTRPGDGGPHQRGDRSPRLRPSSMVTVEEETTPPEDKPNLNKLKPDALPGTTQQTTTASMHPNGTTNKDTVAKEPNGSAQTETVGDMGRRESAASTSSAKQVTFELEEEQEEVPLTRPPSQEEGPKVIVGTPQDKEVANGPVRKSPPISPSSSSSNANGESITIVNETESNGRTRPVLKKQKSKETTRL